MNLSGKESPRSYGAVVVGSGPNGLAAALRLAQAGLSIAVFEARGSIGGCLSTEELTAPGFRHDVLSSVYPLAAASPYLRTLPLDRHGLEWIRSPALLAHPLDDGTAVVLEPSVEATARNLGRDAGSYQRLVGLLVPHWRDLVADLLRPLGVPRHPLLFSRFGLRAIRSAAGLARSTFVEPRARALFAGLGAHSIMHLDRLGSAAVGLSLCIMGHAVGWPIARGGSEKIAEAMADYLRVLGGEVFVNRPVESFEGLPEARAVMLDLTPHQVSRLGGRLPERYRRRLAGYRYGPGAFKVEWALDAPIPWRAERCLSAATVHLGGTLEEVVEAEDAVWSGRCPERPFVILTQQSIFDSTRAPEGRHTAGAYCHVPNGSNVDMTAAIEAQVERFAPGFRDRIIGRYSMSPVDIERLNANCVGGDIGGGTYNLGRLLCTGMRRGAYLTPVRNLYICASSTPPGAGVHGMCGYHAAVQALRQMRR